MANSRLQVALGVTWETVAAWEASAKNVLRILEAHLADHDFILGGRSSVADYGLLGPLYAHLWRDPVPGAMIKRDYPRVERWVQRASVAVKGVKYSEPLFSSARRRRRPRGDGSPLSEGAA